MPFCNGVSGYGSKFGPTQKGADVQQVFRSENTERTILREKSNIAVSFETKRGKGSHGTLYYGRYKTILKDRKKGNRTWSFKQDAYGSWP